ncbi:phospholipase D-like domain-containing protein [Mucilaginibacter flavidus]|uniref:phospholipase D-like domain-containing protein n=1 Tax=Mucilaginibacter flavidus TaxID=2949309 RepID=UPI002093CEDB|nr:phospholipase D-like domain-containing protein [Mucilaginibacter flavidus]MCO5950901.1 phospholipase D-like domain-containing protein [Mucilaginibacter flavidus]
MPDKEHQGKIKWYDAKKAFGFMISEDGSDIFFHWKSVADLTPEQLVTELPVAFTLIKGRNDRVEALRVSPAKAPMINQPTDLLATIMGRNKNDYNVSLLAQLMAGLYPIKDETSYAMAIELLAYADTTGLAREVKQHCFKIANDRYRLKFWLNGIIEYCDLGYLARTFEKAPPAHQQQIAERLSTYSLNRTPIPPKVLFEKIQAQLLTEIAAAKHHIRIAVAWFTHQLQFNALIAKLKEGVQVELVIINDYINNWEFGLPFKDFVEAGGQLYLTGPERVMHHKFCLIDAKVLCNGSYNWTYYAEERNQENCMFFYGEENLIRQFNEAFEKLIHEMEPVKDILPPPFPPERYDLFSRRMYQSIDLQYKAQSKPAGERQQAVRLLREAVTLYPENIQAKTLIDQWVPSDESTLKAQAVAQTTSAIQQQIVQAQQVATTPVTTATTPVTQPPQRTVSDLQARLVVAESLQHRNYEGQRGKLRINLVWNTFDDLDLHVLLPDNQEISYSTKKVTCQGFIGQLDLDANAGTPRIQNPQENIYWDTGLPVGTYKVSVVHYAQQELARVPFAVSIIPESGEATLLTGIVEFSSTHKATVEVAELSYAANGLTVKSLLA